MKPFLTKLITWYPLDDGGLEYMEAVEHYLTFAERADLAEAQVVAGFAETVKVEARALSTVELDPEIAAGPWEIGVLLSGGSEPFVRHKNKVVHNE